MLYELSRALWLRGLRQRSSFWLSLAVGIAVVRFTIRLFHQHEVSALVELQPGDALQLQGLDPHQR